MVAGACSVGTGLRAQSESEPTDPELDALERELEAELALPSWQFSTEAEAAFGYRSNPLLAAFDRTGSTVTQTNINALIWRLPIDGFEWSNLLDVTTSQYSDPSINDAWLGIFRSAIRWQLDSTSEMSVIGRYVYHDEVIDASSLESGFGSTRARLRSPGLEAGYKRQIGESWRASGKLSFDFSDFQAPLDDFRSYVAGFELERGLGGWGWLTAKADLMWRDYVSREQAAVGGRDLPGTYLSVLRPGFGVSYELRGGGDWRWTTQVETEYRRNNDNASGWYDYDQYTARAAITLDGGPWHVEADGEWTGYRYLVQTEGFGDPPKRRHDGWTFTGRFEREIGQSWCVFLEFELDLSRSNDPFLVYDDALTLAGLRWTR